MEGVAEENTDDILHNSLWFMSCGYGWNDRFGYFWKQEFFCLVEESN